MYGLVNKAHMIPSFELENVCVVEVKTHITLCIFEFFLNMFVYTGQISNNSVWSPAPSSVRTFGS